jgi:Fe2+ or Zn2+ uptake regulation protein
MRRVARIWVASPRAIDSLGDKLRSLWSSGAVLAYKIVKKRPTGEDARFTLRLRSCALSGDQNKISEASHLSRKGLAPSHATFLPLTGGLETMNGTARRPSLPKKMIIMSRAFSPGHPSALHASLELFLISFLSVAVYDTVKLSPETTQQLVANGIRLTKQREEVFGILLQKRDHPTATEVFLRAKKHMPSISLATIYNCLEALVDCGLVKQVNLDRAPTRFCANLQEHSHFYCEGCGSISDVALSLNRTWELPPGFVVVQADVSLRGMCPKCSTRDASGATRSKRVSQIFENGETAEIHSPDNELNSH